MKTVYMPVGVILPWSNIELRDPLTKKKVGVLPGPPSGQVGYIPIYDSLAQMQKELSHDGEEVQYETLGIPEEGDAPPGFPDF